MGVRVPPFAPSFLLNHFRATRLLVPKQRVFLQLRLGCGLLLSCFRWRVQLIDEMDVPPRQEVHILVCGELYGTVAELVANVRQGRARLNEQTSEGVAQVVETYAAQPGALQRGQEVLLAVLSADQLS